jgi:peptide/nickel transport system substrate-binding protein
MYPRNLDKARELLTEAGWVDVDGDGIREKDGEELELGWYCIHNEIIGEVVAEQFKEIGVKINVQLVPGPVQLEAAQQKTYDFMYERERGPDIGYLWLFWHSDNAKPGGWAWTGFTDPELDMYLDIIKTSTKEETRFAASAEAQRIIMENALMVPTVAQPIFWVLKLEVKNFRPTVAGNYFHLYDVWLD